MYERRKSSPIKSWAADDRPREKLLSKGKAALTDSELLAILINTGSGEESAVDLAKKILSSCKNNLNELGKLSVHQLVEHKGIGHAKAITIIAAMELSRRRSAGTLSRQSRIGTSRDVARYCQNILRDHRREVFLVIFLKTNSKIIDHQILFQGGMSGTIVDPKIIFQMALEKKATRLILCHNHPSGNLNPSQQDIFLTDHIAQAGKLLDIKVVDHIIVSEEGFYSFADEGKI